LHCSRFHVAATIIINCSTTDCRKAYNPTSCSPGEEPRAAGGSRTNEEPEVVGGSRAAEEPITAGGSCTNEEPEVVGGSRAGEEPDTAGGSCANEEPEVAVTFASLMPVPHRDRPYTSRPRKKHPSYDIISAECIAFVEE